jgi:thiamine-phosphate pyrophosphorylase
MTHYAITDPDLYGTDIPTFFSTLDRVLHARRPDMIVLRNKRAGVDYAAYARDFLARRDRWPGIRFLLHGDVALAASLGADGVHLPSTSIEAVPQARAAGLWTIVSTHDCKEARLAERLGADAVTFSPVFHSPGKGVPQGLEKLKEIKDKINIKLFALGGIVREDQIAAVESAGADGFASIRYFVTNLPQGTDKP